MQNQTNLLNIRVDVNLEDLLQVDKKKEEDDRRG